MKALVIENLSLVGAIHELPLLKGITFEVEEGELMVILGPTGAGKTLLLESIAGFHKLHLGRIFLYQKEISNLPPEKRNVGMIFQDYALFPHITVRQNILFGTRYRNHQANQFAKLVDLLKITHLLDRFPQTLSGGEKQRVSIARALITEPKLLLFDEPLAALDEELRLSMRDELKPIIKELGITSLYVTHDQLEAIVLGDRVTMIEKGEILQVDTPYEIFNAPRNERVAKFTGVETILYGIIKSQRDGLAIIDVNGIEIEAITPRAIGEKVILCIRSENVGIVPLVNGTNGVNTKTSVRNKLRCRVKKVMPLGPIIKLNLDCGIPIISAITRQSYEELELAENNEIVASFKATAVHVI